MKLGELMSWLVAAICAVSATTDLIEGHYGWFWLEVVLVAGWSALAVVSGGKRRC